MELQLGLAVQSYSSKGFDLNSKVYEEQSKRRFDEAFPDGEVVNPTLPLLLLFSDQPGDEDGRKNPNKEGFCHSFDQNDEEENGIVGWPPIKTSQRKIFRGGYVTGNGRKGNGYCVGAKSMYVKVNMEGVGIGRKVNLNLYQSYRTLTASLIAMFTKYQKNLNESIDGGDYTLTYQDKEGDWLLVGDAPWQNFIGSVQRLKIKRKDMVV